MRRDDILDETPQGAALTQSILKHWHTLMTALAARGLLQDARRRISQGRWKVDSGKWTLLSCE